MIRSACRDLDSWSHTVEEHDGIVYFSMRGPLCVDPPEEAMHPYYQPWIDADEAANLLSACRVDDRCLGVVPIFDSPGGQCYAVPRVIEAMDALCAVKPVFAYAAESMLSAAYWIGARAHRVWCASELSQVGSIGTIFKVLDNSEHFAKLGLAAHALTDAPLKSMGVDGVAVSEEHLIEYHRQIELMSELFLRHLGQSRGITPEIAKSLGGRAVHAVEAVSMGLADAIVPRLSLHERAVAEMTAMYEASGAEQDPSPQPATASGAPQGGEGAGVGIRN